jgi:hypothetical protein
MIYLSVKQKEKYVIELRKQGKTYEKLLMNSRYHQEK